VTRGAGGRGRGLVAALLAAVCVLAVAPASPEARAAGCADVLLVGVRGSGEGGTGLPGPTVRVVRDAYVAAARAGGATVTERYVDYDAPSVAALHLTGHPGRTATSQVTARTVRAWSAGVRTGVDRTVAYLTTRAGACPDQPVVLVGYAQGAMVLHRTLTRMHTNGAVVGRVVGAVLVADGDRRSASRAAHTVGAPAAPLSGYGVTQRYTTPPADVPTSDRKLPVWNVCTRGDLACDPRATRLDTAIRVHRSYTSGTAASRLRSAAAALWTRTTDVPVPTPRAGSLATHVAAPVDLQLTATARSGASLSWRALSALPPGLALGRDGRLTGTPTAAGSWTVGYQVRNTRDPAYPTTARGSLQVAVDPAPADAVSAGGGQSCSTFGDGTGRCWGGNGWGELGDGTTTRRLTPVPVASGTGWTSLVTGGATTCGIQGDGSLWCWGLNHHGQVGDGTRTRRLTPVRVGTSTAWASVSPGWWHTCAVRTDGTLWCWGLNARGQLGDGSTTTRLRPVRVPGTGWSGVATGGWHTCAVKADGTAWCWGGNDLGQLGDGTLTSTTSPRQVGTATDWTQLSAAWLSTCGLENGGRLSCWGGNDRGQLGDGTLLNRSTPTAVLAGTPVVSVAAGLQHTCAVTGSGTPYCWGDGSYGELGTGDRRASRRPVPVGTDTDWAAVSVSWFHTCGMRTGGALWCWGDNANGKLGDGTTTLRLTPTPIVTP